MLGFFSKCQTDSVKTHKPANGFPRKKKKNELEQWMEGGRMRVGITEPLSPLSCRVSAFRTRRKRTVCPHLRPPSSSGGLSLSAGLWWVQRQASRGTRRQRRFFSSLVVVSAPGLFHPSRAFKSRSTNTKGLQLWHINHPLWAAAATYIAVAF